MITNIYIDGSNLHKGISSLGWSLDYQRFFRFLRDKYQMKKAYIFMGYIDTQTGLYEYLKNVGFTLVFKETVRDVQGKIKGNCDAELVVQTLTDFYEKELQKMILISGDGDFACVLDFFADRTIPVIVLAPQSQYCSVLLKRRAKTLIFLSELQNKLEAQTKKAPEGDGTH